MHELATSEDNLHEVWSIAVQTTFHLRMEFLKRGGTACFHPMTSREAQPIERWPVETQHILGFLSRRRRSNPSEFASKDRI